MADERDRIVHGPLASGVARFGVPLALGMGLQTTFNLVDAYMIARLDSDVRGPSLGAIGICDQLAAIGTIVSYGLSTATAAIMSRKHGEGDSEGVRRVAWQSCLLVGALSVFFALGALFGADFLMAQVVGAKGQVAVLGARYLRVIVGGSFTIFFLMHLTTIQRALGSSKTPISILVTANVINVVFCVLAIFGPGPAPPVFAWGPPVAAALGIPRLELIGTAWATVAARFLVLVPLVVLIDRRFKLFRRPERVGADIAAIRQIVGIGWASSAQLVVRLLAMLLVHSLVARAFTTASDQRATTALGVVFRLETMALFVGLGWGSAAQTFMGQNLGAGRPDRARLAGWYAAFYNVAMMALLALAYRAWAAPIVAFFDDDPAVVALGVSYVKWVGPSYVGLGIGIVLGAAIQGTGATRQTLWLDSLVVFAFQLPASLFVVYGFGASIERLWAVVALTYVLFALVYVWSYRRGRFLQTVIA